MKFKHNKKRNTAFLFEALVRELTKTVVTENREKKAEVLQVMQKHFSKGSVLSKELSLYKSLNEDTNMKPGLAEKLLYEVKIDYHSLDKKEIFNAQSALINDINKKLSKSVMSNFVPNYKNLATVYQILNPGGLSPKARVILEEEFVKELSTETEPTASLPPIDNLALKTFVNKFNKEYSGSLLSEQKDLLNKYITSYRDNGLELKIFLNEELDKIKNKLKEAVKSPSNKLDSFAAEKTNRVLNIIESFKQKEIDTSMIEAVLKIQKLTKEISEDEN
tara:strand:+ start:383 stop:1213 length:831 start_codon:yes stop_codon:yes gene_type:complete